MGTCKTISRLYALVIVILEIFWSAGISGVPGGCESSLIESGRDNVSLGACSELEDTTR
jgi:hypothetical protein